MKSIVVMSFILLAGVAGNAVAQSCPGGTTRVSNVTQLVGGNTLCAARGTDRWQEFHSGTTSGPLIDWKRGPGHPVDPTATVGTWAAQNGVNSLVTHTYGATSFSWLVCQVGATTTFTLEGASGTITGATFIAGQGPCP